MMTPRAQRDLNETELYLLYKSRESQRNRSSILIRSIQTQQYTIHEPPMLADPARVCDPSSQSKPKKKDVPSTLQMHNGLFYLKDIPDHETNVNLASNK